MVLSACPSGDEASSPPGPGAAAAVEPPERVPAQPPAADAPRVDPIPGSPYTLDPMRHAVARIGASPIREPAPTDAAALLQWQPLARARLARELGVRHIGPELVPLELVELAATALDDGALTRSELSWFSEPGLRTRAFLFRPTGPGPHPGVVFWHGHTDDGRFASAGLAGPDDPHNAGALELARAGYVVLAPDIRTLHRGTELTDHYYFQSLVALRGTTAIGIFVSDALRAIDVLESLPEVDPERIGVTGLSLGGYLTLFSAALDPRVDAAVVAGFLGSYRGILLRERQCGCQYAGPLGSVYDLADIAAMAAPQPIRFVAGLADRDMPVADQRGAFATLEPIWAALDAPADLELVEHPGGHEWVRDPAVEWFARHLQVEPAEAP